MRRFLLALSVICSLLLFSCQKEVDYAMSAIDNGAIGASGTLLVRKVDKQGSDSVVNTFQYNSAKKLTKMKRQGIEDGSAVNTEYHYYRNNSGIITSISIIDAGLASLGFDSAVVDVRYTTRYTNSVTKLMVSGAAAYFDSSAFVYNPSGNISIHEYYENQSGARNDFSLSGKIKAAYVGSNISKMEIFDIDSGNEEFVLSQEFTYDTKKSPLAYDAEGFVLMHPEWVSANNVLTMKVTMPSDPDSEGVATYTYQYNSNNLPKTGIVIFAPQGVGFDYAFYYQ